MSDLDGFTVAERIRREPMLAGVIAMLRTSGVLSGDVARCRKLGIARHLIKPLMPRVVLDTGAHAGATFAGGGSCASARWLSEAPPS